MSNGPRLTVLYKIVNSSSDKDDGLFNAFTMPLGGKPLTLASVKQYVDWLVPFFAAEN